MPHQTVSDRWRHNWTERVLWGMKTLHTKCSSESYFVRKSGQKDDKSHTQSKSSHSCWIICQVQFFQAYWMHHNLFSVTIHYSALALQCWCLIVRANKHLLVNCASISMAKLLLIVDILGIYLQRRKHTQDYTDCKWMLKHEKQYNRWITCVTKLAERQRCEHVREMGLHCNWRL